LHEISVQLGGSKGFLRKTVPPVQAVRKVSLELHEGEILSLVGESGCGKTTLGRAILGLQRESAGEILLDDRPVGGLSPEVIEQALRKSIPVFPELAVRESTANALIHQDFFVTGSGPTVEVFDDRIEITNPGEPLVDTQRFVDTPRKSRNEALASLMRRVRICEERGSGIDKVVSEVEVFQLPAPLFEQPQGFTRVVLFAHKPLTAMDKSERVRACYLHACLRYVTRQPMTNASVRERFGIAERNASIASRLLNEAVEAGQILLEDPEVGTRVSRYVPFWAASESRKAIA